MPVLELENIHKAYPVPGGARLSVLRGINLTAEEGSVVAIVGASGSGKSTLLHIIGSLDRPDEGDVRLDGEDVFRLPEEGIARFRNEHVGFVFQFHHLLPEFTAAENVAMPALIRGVRKEEALRKADELLAQMNIADRAAHRPAELSGGEQQRVAVARALVNQPRILLADEPSGNLDEENGRMLHRLLISLARERNLTVIVVTHNREFSLEADVVRTLHEGILDGKRSTE